MAVRVFVSYSRADLAFVDRLDQALRARDIEPMVDRTEIYAFEDWWNRIQALIARADTIVFVLSPDSVASQVCEREVAFSASLNKRLAPIVSRSCDEQHILRRLKSLNFIFFDVEKEFDDAVEAQRISASRR